MTQKHIKQRCEDGVGWITFDRPEKMNAVNPVVLEELQTAISRCEEDEAVKVVVLTGNQKAFVAGADIDHMATGNSGDAYRLTDLTMRVQERLADLAKPTIAAVSGFALGAGCEIALCCDFRIAADNAVFGLPEITLGIIPGGGGTQRLARLINPSRAARMVMLGEMVKADEALSIGLVDKVVEFDRFADETTSFARRLARMPVLAVRAAKQAMRNGLNCPLKGGLKIEQDLFCALFDTQDQKEGMAAFLEKRKPVFTGT